MEKENTSIILDGKWAQLFNTTELKIKEQKIEPPEENPKDEEANKRAERRKQWIKDQARLARIRKNRSTGWI